MQPHRGHCIILRLRWGWPIAKAPARLRCRVEPCRASALPGTHPGTAAMLPDGNVPSLPRYLSLPTATAPWAKSGARQPQEPHGRGGGTQPATAKGPHSSFLECCLTPVASTQPVPWAVPSAKGCAMPQSCAVPRISPTAHRLLPVPVGAWGAGQVAGGPGGLRSRRPAGLGLGSAAVPGGGRPVPVSSSGSRARRGEGPAHTEL